MKRTLIAALTAITLIFTTISCGKTTSENEDTTSANKTTVSSSTNKETEKSEDKDTEDKNTEDVTDTSTTENQTEVTTSDDTNSSNDNITSVQASGDTGITTYTSSSSEVASQSVATPVQDTSVPQAPTNTQIATPPSTSNDAPSIVEPTPEPVITKTYTDGRYSGSAQGCNGTITVSVTISDDTITKIVIADHKDDEPFISNASAVINSIIATQSTSVDAVSGATLSSNGIINAVANALASARN